MKRYYINGVESGNSWSSRTTTIHFSVDGETKHLTILEFEDAYSFILLDENHHEEIMENIFDSDFAEYLEENMIDEFDGIPLADELEDVFEEIHGDADNPAAQVIILLLDAFFEGKNMAIEKYADEIQVNITDIERQCLEDAEED